MTEPSPSSPSPDPHAEAHERLKKRTRALVRDWLIPLLLVAIVLAPLRASALDWNDVPSGSMRPTILEGDRIVVNKLAYGLRVPFTHIWISRWATPERGDIVTFASPADGIRLVKRVIGLPGDHVAMRNNRLIVNGHPIQYKLISQHAQGRMPNGTPVDVHLASELLPEGSPGTPVRPHELTITPGVLSVNTFSEVVVPAGEIYVMGDNRDLSNDSRFYGFVPLKNLYGQVTSVALSVNPEESYIPRWKRWFSRLR